MTAQGDQETRTKVAQIRAWLEPADAGAVRLRGCDWFAWATGGASNAVALSSECGAAEVLVTPHCAYILTDEVEVERQRQEQVQGSWTWQVSPWILPELREHFVAHAAAGKMVLSDHPRALEKRLAPELCAARLVLGLAERQRYRQVGGLAAAAVSETLHAARPHWTEYELAGAAAHALMARGLQPVMLLAAGAARLARYRQAPPSVRQLGERAMLAVCARRYGLHANLTRFVQFGGSAHEQDAAMMALEAVALNACEVGQPLCMVYKALDGAYAYAGQSDAIGQHYQGGLTGYRRREVLLTRHSETRLKDGMVLALHPSVRGNTIEDTFLIENGELENLTCDPAWPAVQVQGRCRPQTLTRP